jgi:hypothetical protein
MSSYSVLHCVEYLLIRLSAQVRVPGCSTQVVCPERTCQGVRVGPAGRPASLGSHGTLSPVCLGLARC